MLKEENRATQNRATQNRATQNRATQNWATQNRATQNRATQNRATQNTRKVGENVRNGMEEMAGTLFRRLRDLHVKCAQISPACPSHKT